MCTLGKGKRHRHGYRVSQLRAQSLWTQRCAECRRVIPTFYGWMLAALVGVVVVAELLR